jgi:hypothetical protein
LLSTVIPALRKLKQDYGKLQARLGYIERSCIKITTKKTPFAVYYEKCMLFYVGSSSAYLELIGPLDCIKEHME